MKLANFEDVPFKGEHAVEAMSENEISETHLLKSIEDNLNECSVLKPRIVDDSSDEHSNINEEPQTPKMQALSTFDKDEKMIEEEPLKKKKIKKPILEDSDSEEELLSTHDSYVKRDKPTMTVKDINETYPNESMASRSPEMQSLSTSDLDENMIEEETRKKKKIRKPISDDSDTEEELSSTDYTNKSGDKSTNVEDTDKPYSYKSMFQNTDLYDAEGSSDEDPHHPCTSYEKNENEYEQENIKLKGAEKKPDSKGAKKRSTSHRKSKQSALEEIHSETQRLIRHSRVSLPYHQPKQRSLSEFLSRRKVVPIVPLKISSDQLSEVWQSIEEREKSAEQFYKSESSEEENTPPSDKARNNENSSPIYDNGELSLTETGKKISTINASETPSQMESTGENDVNSVIGTENMELTAVCDKGSSNNSSSEENEKELMDTRVFPDSNNLQPIVENSCNLNSENPITTPVENSEEFKLILLSEKENYDSHEGCELIHSDLNSDSSKYTLKKPIDNCTKLEVRKRLSLFNNSLLDIKLDDTPKINGNPEELIDLEKVAEKPAALKLVSRFMKHVSLKPKLKNQEEKVSIAITEINAKGEVVNLSEEIVSIKTSNKTKPGETRFQLKAKLKQKIAQCREEQFVKRIEEYKLNEEFYEGEKEVCSDLEDHDEEIEPSESSESESEPEENDVDLRDKGKNKDNPFLDEEAEESENEDDDEIEPECDTYSDPPSIDVAPLIDDKDCSDNLKTDVDATASGNDALSSDLMALCSGVFPTQNVSFKDLEKCENIESQSEGLNLFTPEDATLDMCGDERKLHGKGGDESSDEEIFTKKTKRKLKLKFSDDEDDENSKISMKSAESNKSLEGDEEEEILNDKFIDDESQDIQNEEDEVHEEEEDVLDEEEEEIFHDPSKAAKRFLEDEAELSGSEYGSADEDEVDLDNYEEEQGDQDQINQKKLKTELGKIHMKEILDEDKREIRILQELLLEDGELHSDGPRRQRQFKWYNQDETDADRGIYMNSFDDEEDTGEGTTEVLEEEDESWRKTRLERENYLQELQKTDDDFDLIQSVKKFSKPEKKTVKPAPKVCNMPSPNPKKHFSLISKRGSFLSRGDKVLSKLAEMTNISSENPLGNSRGKKNMVFAIVSPPKEEEPQEQAKKRKSSASLPDVAKRLKFSPGNLNLNSRKSIFENLD